MTRRWTSWLAWLVWLVTLGVVPVSVALDVAARTDASIVLFSGFGSSLALCGAVVVSRHRGRLIGWLLLAIGLAGTVSGGAAAYGRFIDAAAAAGALRGLAGAVSNLGWVLMAALLALLVQVFPTGRPLSSRWRPLTWLTAAWLIIAVAVSMLPEALGERLFVTYLLRALLLVIVASAISLILRFVRSKGEERQQLKWFAYATGLVLFPLVLTLSGVDSHWSGLALNVTTYGLPLAIGIAILRYRLYDIDVLINRTLVYGALSATLLAAYVLSVLALSALLRPLTGSSDLAVAGSTLAVVAAFGPLRARIQSVVDRRFYRSRYDAAHALDAFGARLRDEVDLDSVRADLLDVVGATLRPAHASLWLRK